MKPSSAIKPVTARPAPVPRWQRVVSTLVTAHVILVATSLLSVVAPSELMLRVLSLADPYLRATQFGLDDRPIFLARGVAEEQPLTLAASPGESLLPEASPGGGVDDRQQRFLASLAMLVQQEQPSLVSELVVPLVKASNRKVSGKSIAAVELQRHPTPWLRDDAGEVTTLYTADCLIQDSEIVLIHQPAPRFLSLAVEGESP